MAKTETSAAEQKLSNYGSTTGIPKWMMVATIICLAVRLIIVVSESINPPKSNEQIQWVLIDNVSSDQRAAGKLFFYSFGADWCDPCKEIEKTAFSSRDIVRELNKDFIPVKVIDRKREDGKNPSAVQEMEDTFSVQAFPTLVVAMPDGTKIEEHLGAINTSGLKRFLSEATTLSDYFRGKELMIHGDVKNAAATFETFLEKTNWAHWRCPYAAIFCAISQEEQGATEKKNATLTKALATFKDHAFPYPIMQYLADKISFDQLLKDAGENKSSRLSAYAYSGLHAFAQKRYEEAEQKLSWVINNSNDESSFENRISRAELARIKNRKLTNSSNAISDHNNTNTGIGNIHGNRNDGGNRNGKAVRYLLNPNGQYQGMPKN